MTNQDMQGPYIQLAIPERHYLKVVQFLGRLDSGESGDPRQAVTDAELEKTPHGRIKVSSRPAKEWTSSELTQLKHEIKSRRRYLAPLFELMAANPGGYVHKADYEKASGFSGRQLRSSLAGLSQHIGKRYERSNWPFSWEWGCSSLDRSASPTPRRRSAAPSMPSRKASTRKTRPKTIRKRNPSSATEGHGRQRVTP